MQEYNYNNNSTVVSSFFFFLPPFALGAGACAGSFVFSTARGSTASTFAFLVCRFGFSVVAG